jgi:hypothetical protein
MQPSKSLLANRRLRRFEEPPTCGRSEWTKHCRNTKRRESANARLRYNCKASLKVSKEAYDDTRNSRIQILKTQLSHMAETV